VEHVLPTAAVVEEADEEMVQEVRVKMVIILLDRLDNLAAPAHLRPQVPAAMGKCHPVVSMVKVELAEQLDPTVLLEVTHSIKLTQAQVAQVAPQLLEILLLHG
jgi:hypothetical protein